MPDEPGEFTLRLGTDYRQRNSDANAALPYAEACFGLMERLYQRKLYLLAEINGDWGRANQAAIAPGIKYLLSERFSVGVAAPIGLNRNDEAWGIVTQFQFEF